MNKTLCAGLVAFGIAVSAFAEEKAAQVYDLTVTVKTTTAKKATLSPKRNKFISDSESVIYRTQATQKWKGLIWGCDCNTLMGKWEVVNEKANFVSGCVIWKTSKPYDVIFLDDINWRLLNAIDKKGDKCEGSWTLGDMSEDAPTFLTFAGFGTLQVVYTAAPCEDPEVNCTSYLKSMTGNVAGWMPAPTFTTPGSDPHCYVCGDYEPGEEDTVEIATAWDFCPCEEYADIDFTAVSGTWSLKYNAAASSKLMKEGATLVKTVKLPARVEELVTEKTYEILGK
ncbi:MAG: hypothetical protein IKJ45_09925 [Kiritimatiellae bacterium]|nr:hypothetical protein [Kiritimatiellia bacterium]